jgi:hypothetical protein
MRASWSVFFMDWCYYPLAYFLVLFVVFGMAIDWDWDAMREDFAKFREERREQQRLEEESERERPRTQHRGCCVCPCSM